MKIVNRFLFLLWLILGCFACNPEAKEEEKEVRSAAINTAAASLPYTIKMTYEHDAEAFTQGLVFHGNKVFESTGTEGSWIAEVNLENGLQNKKVVLDPEYFGEGITILNNKVYQLTWRHKHGFIYDVETFRQIGHFNYDSEGWGITTDQKHLIMSDGTNKLYYLDTLTFKPQKTLAIKDNGMKVEKLNELEYINGYIFANQWETNYILKINPQTEQVVGRLDLSSLAAEIKRNHPEADVLNGIAYNPATGDILVTGKRWPKSYLISLHN